MSTDKNTAETSKSEKAEWKTNPEYAEYAEVRENIVTAAAAVIEEVGVEKLRLGQVAKKAGCVRQTLYRYFNSKKELVEAVMLHFTLLNAADVSAHISGIEDPKKRLVEVIFRAAMNLGKDPKYKIFRDLRNMELYSDFGAGTVFQTMDSFSDTDTSEFGMHIDGISNKEFYIWVALQSIAISSFGLTDWDEDKLKNFIERLIVTGPL